MEFECGACYRIFNSKKVHTLKCKHNICRECTDTTSRIICPECGDDFVIVSDTLTNGSATTSILHTTIDTNNATVESIDGWKITLSYFENGREKSVIYSKDEKPHSKEDRPAEIHYYENGKIKLKFWQNKGKLHRSRGFPAVIKWKKSGKLEYQEWWVNGVCVKKIQYENYTPVEPAQTQENPKKETPKKEQLYYVVWYSTITGRRGIGEKPLDEKLAKTCIGAKNGICHYLIREEERDKYIKDMSKTCQRHKRVKSKGTMTLTFSLA